jgi:hypothetical protein
MMTQTIEAWRMENSAGHGPFADMPADPRDIVTHVPWMKAMRLSDGNYGIKSDSTHPHHMLDIPEADLGGDYFGALAMMLGSPMKVGVKDKEQFLHWFPKSSLDYFAKHGFKADIYSVPAKDVKFGKYQLMFDSSKAHLVKSETLKELEQES